MKLITKVLLYGLTAVAFLVAGCKKADETAIIKKLATGYWEALFQGETRTAYEMLDSKSQTYIVYGDYTRKVGFGPGKRPEVDEYWAAYYSLTQIEVTSVVIDRKGESAVVSFTLTQPDPTWFPDEAVREADSLGLTQDVKGKYVLKAMTKALKEARVPIVKTAENTKLVMEDDEWRVVFNP